MIASVRNRGRVRTRRRPSVMNFAIVSTSSRRDLSFPALTKNTGRTLLARLRALADCTREHAHASIAANITTIAANAGGDVARSKRSRERAIR